MRRSDLLLMPLPMFELIHLGAYNIELLVSYIRVMSFLDLDLVLAKQVIRQTFGASSNVFIFAAFSFSS